MHQRAAPHHLHRCESAIISYISALRRTAPPRIAASHLAAALCRSFSLLLRTLGSVWVSKHWGRIVKALVTKDFPSMKRLVLQFACGTISLAILNATLKYYISTLREQVRERVTAWCHRHYMREKDMIYYKANKVGDHKIENADHQITSDVDKFSETFASVLSQSLKPIVDFVVYSVELSRVQGLATPLTLYGWFAFASAVSCPLRQCAQPKP